MIDVIETSREQRGESPDISHHIFNVGAASRVSAVDGAEVVKKTIFLKT